MTMIWSSVVKEILCEWETIRYDGDVIMTDSLVIDT